jgi:hypothetical protein
LVKLVNFVFATFVNPRLLNIVLIFRYLTTEGIEQVTENGAITDIKAIIRKAIDVSF